MIEFIANSDPFSIGTMILSLVSFCVALFNFVLICHALYKGKVTIAGNFMLATITLMSMFVSFIYGLYYVQIGLGNFSPQIHGPTILRPTNLPLLITYIVYMIWSTAPIYKAEFSQSEKIHVFTEDNLKEIIRDALRDREGE